MGVVIGSRPAEESLSEDPSHFFICYSSRDQATALEVVQFLEAGGLRCWISARDILPGYNYQESIVAALEAADGLVFLFSEASNASAEIRKELSLAASSNRPVFPLRLSPVKPSGALRYELATRQWIDIFPNREKALGTLARSMRQVLAEVREPRLTAHSATPSEAAPRHPSPGMPPAGADARPPPTPIIAPGGAQFEAIRALLARHIGPIAKVYVQKAAAEARTREEFCERLAACISASRDRTAFVKAVRTHLA
jgi:hypothetical protein